MAQFGGATSITSDIRLILLDCFETMVELDGDRYVARQGMREFLSHFGSRVGIPLVVISDAAQAQVKSALDQAALTSYLTGFYHAGNAAEVLPDGRVRKRLDRPMADFGAKPHQTVFIGDSPLDAEAAKHHRVQFIRVPRSEDRAFSFGSLISGPSRYRSQEFNITFLDRYRKGPSQGGKP